MQLVDLGKALNDKTDGKNVACGFRFITISRAARLSNCQEAKYDGHMKPIESQSPRIKSSQEEAIFQLVNILTP